MSLPWIRACPPAESDAQTGPPYGFIAHSVVLTARREMVDVTLPAAVRLRLFLAYPFDFCGFFAIFCSPPLAGKVRVFVAPVGMDIGAGGRPPPEMP